MTLLKRAEKVGGKFLNPVPTQVGGFSTVFKVLPEYLKDKAEREPKQELGPFRTDVGVYATEPASGLRVTWFGIRLRWWRSMGCGVDRSGVGSAGQPVSIHGTEAILSTDT